MSDTLANLRGKIDGADKLKSVVRTMKAMAASSIGQYEAAVASLTDYERTVTLGLNVCFRKQRAIMNHSAAAHSQRSGKAKTINAIVFGSDQGLVGQFNDAMGRFVVDALKKLAGEKRVWIVGERLHTFIQEANFPIVQLYSVPNSISAITKLVGRIQVDIEAAHPSTMFDHDQQSTYVFHNAPLPGDQYQPVCQRLLPLDAAWQRDIAAISWPSASLPEELGSSDELLRALIREYLFISLFKASAESLASENASRLAAMQRAEKNINELSARLSRDFYRMRQGAIDEELFDVVSGFNAFAPHIAA